MNKLNKNKNKIIKKKKFNKKIITKIVLNL